MDQKPTVIDGSFLEGGGQILRLAVTYSAIFGIPIRVINIRANRPKPGLAQQHLHGVKLVADLCNGRLKGDYIGSTEIELWPSHIKGGKFEVNLSTAGSIGLMLQCALPVALFADNDVFFSLGGGTDCSFAPLIDYTRDVLGHYLKKFGVDMEMEIKQRGLFPKGGGRVEIKVKKMNTALKSILMEDCGKCAQITVNVIYTGRDSEMASDRIIKAAEQSLKELRSKGIAIKTKKYKETKIIPGSADTALLDISYDTDSGVKCSTSRILDNPQGNKRKYNAESFQDRCQKFEKISVEAAQEILGYLTNSTCCDRNMQDQLIVYMALANGTSKIVVDQLTDHTKTTQYVTNLLTKAQVNFIPLEDGVRHIIQITGIGFRNDSREN